jgi:RND family efflux transporter MFP subunit
MVPQNDAKSNKSPAMQSCARFRRMLPALVVLLLLGLVGILFVRIHSKAETIKSRNLASMNREKQVPNVVTLTLSPSVIRDRINLPGVTAPWVELELKAEVAGKIVSKAVAEGEEVQKGATLITLDSRDYRNAFEASLASYRVALADLKRLETLYQRQVIPQSQLDHAAATVESTRSAMNNARLALERCTITAPFSGVVNRILVEKGQYIAVGDPLLQLLQIERLKVQVGIPESDVDAVRGIATFKLTIGALGEQSFEARKYFLSKTADPMARLYNLELELDNAHGEILPDMFVRVEIVKHEVPKGLSVPLYAVINRDAEHIVYVVENNQARARPVKLGMLEGWRVQITEGLHSQEQVIVVGQRSVNDGEPVNVVRTAASSEEILQ